MKGPAGEVGEGEAIAYVVYLNTALRLVDQGNRESARKGILDEHSQSQYSPTMTIW